MTISDICSKAIKPIVTNFHIEPPWMEEKKMCSNCPGHKSSVCRWFRDNIGYLLSCRSFCSFGLWNWCILNEKISSKIVSILDYVIRSGQKHVF